ncbi:hypothetical protein FHY56_14155 [Brucella gallinifaecis]|uniref:Uncharacterized protein n=1 Tax=Brucella gallinifaecis TaxID=215590 RepID=A0A502BKH9_9HYPH|nr:hypothetical protein FHY56_14155 [Brucella gallinifaecis]
MGLLRTSSGPGSQPKTSTACTRCLMKTTCLHFVLCTT